MVKTVITYSKKIEGILGELNAEGKGLIEKTENIKDTLKLNNKLVNKLHYIGKVRNQVVHGEENITISEKFKETAESVIEELKSLLPEPLDEYKMMIEYTKELEKALKNLGAEGKSLHELITNIEYRLSYPILKQVRYIASVRNRLIHEDGYEIDNPKDYFNLYREIIDEFNKVNSLKDSPSQDNSSEQYYEKDNTIINIILNKVLAQIFLLLMLIWSITIISNEVENYKLEQQIKVLQFGNSNDEIKKFQKVLYRLNYYNGKIDGIHGKGFTEAIKKFKKDKGLKEDGLIGVETYKLLLKNLQENTKQK